MKTKNKYEVGFHTRKTFFSARLARNIFEMKYLNIM